MRQRLLNLPPVPTSALPPSEQQECVGASASASTSASGSGSGSSTDTHTLGSRHKSPSPSDQVLVMSIPRHPTMSPPSPERFLSLSTMTSSHVLRGCPVGHPLRHKRTPHDDQLLQAQAVIKKRTSFPDVLYPLLLTLFRQPLVIYKQCYLLTLADSTVCTVL